MADIVKFLYRNASGYQTQQAGYIAKSELASGRVIVKVAPALSSKGEILPARELQFTLSGVSPADRPALIAAMTAFEAAKFAAKPAAKPAVAPTKATLKALEAAQAAFLKA